MLCRSHHRLVHEGGVAIEARRGGGWRFRRPDGRESEIGYREPAPTYEWTALRETHDAQGIHIDGDTAATRWRGERMDYELGVWTLCAQEERARRMAAGSSESRDVSAETFEALDTFEALETFVDKTSTDSRVENSAPRH